MRPIKVLTSGKYTTKKFCHIPKADYILGKMIKFKVNVISLSKVMTFFISREGMIRPPPGQIGLNYLLNCQRLFNFMELLTFNELLSCIDQIRDNTFLESALKCLKTGQK